MFNFAHRTQKSDGQFNGRFTFLAPHNSPRISPADLRAIANAAPGALANEVIRHEFLHWRVFQSSTVGRALIGKRYRTRAQFLRGDTDAVRIYYTQRSAYFCESFATHERIVEGLERELGNAPSMQDLAAVSLSSRDIRSISDSDQRALELSAECGSPLNWLERNFDSILGRVATREFGVQAYVDLGGPKLALNEVSLKGITYGVFNSATETAYSDAPKYIRIGRKIVRYGNAERWFGTLSPQKLAMWAYLKLNAELTLCQTPRFLRVMSESHGAIESYIRDNVDFIVAYTGASYSHLAKALIAETLLDCGDPGKQFDEMVERLAAINGEFLYFFYAHGN
jgi:surface antigen